MHAGLVPQNNPPARRLVQLVQRTVCAMGR